MPELTFKTLILAAGYGTRLKEKGKKTPKGLFANSQQKSISDFMMQALQKQPNIKNIALVSNHHFFNQYQQHFKQNYPQLNIKILDDGSTNSENRLGSLGDLVFALNKLNWWQDHILVLPSDRTPEDIIPNIISLANQHPQAFITCVAKESKETIKNKCGCAELNDQQQIISFEEKPAKPKSDYRAVPFYVFPPQSLQLLQQYQQADQNMDSPGNIIPWLIKHKFPIYAHVTKKNSFDIGDLSELEKFQQEYHAN